MLILHGENLVASRKRLKEEIDNFRLKFKGEVIKFAGNQVDLTQIKQAVESSSLFGQNRLIVIENLFSGSPSTEKQKIVGFYSSFQIYWLEKIKQINKFKIIIP